MTKEELISEMHLDENERIRAWKELSYDDKKLVVGILKENGDTNAEEAMEGMEYENGVEADNFGIFWLVFDKDDEEDMQSYFDIMFDEYGGEAAIG